MMNRRDLLKLGAAGAWLPFLGPDVWAWANPSSGPEWARIVVLVELSGGNDGLNTVIPIEDDAYRSLRPRLAISKDDALKLDRGMAFHPALKPLMGAWEQRELATVLGVGYDDPNRSHFRSIEIWETGSNSTEFLEQGWLARLFSSHRPPSELAADGIVIGTGDQGPLHGSAIRTVVMRDAERFTNAARKLRKLPEEGENPALDHLLEVRKDLRRAATLIHEKREKTKLGVDFPNGRFSRSLKTAAELLVSKVPVAVVKVRHGGFDTHTGQAGRHRALLTELAGGLAAFRTAMQKAGLWDRVLVMTYSEFGRRAAENGSGGTDHGTAAPHLLLGGRVRGGVHGKQPSLTDLLPGGDLKHTVDYRSLYATVAQEWWRLPAAGSHSPLDLIRKSETL